MQTLCVCAFKVELLGSSLINFTKQAPVRSQKNSIYTKQESRGNDPTTVESSLTLMDPVSLTLAIAPLVLSSTKIIAVVRSVKQTYGNAQALVKNIEQECDLICLALHEVQGLVLPNKPGIAIHMKSYKSLEATFDSVLTGCRMTLDALKLEVEGVLKSEKESNVEPINMTFKSKGRFVWKEDTMRNLMEQMRNQRDSIHFLITILQRYVMIF